MLKCNKWDKHSKYYRCFYYIADLALWCRWRELFAPHQTGFKAQSPFRPPDETKP